jgi:hypothetical protein
MEPFSRGTITIASDETDGRYEGENRAKMKTTLQFIVISITLLLLSRAAAAADRMRLVSVPLDVPLEDTEALDNQALEGLYQGDYGKSIKFNVGGYLPDHVKIERANRRAFLPRDSVH